LLSIERNGTMIDFIKRVCQALIVLSVLLTGLAASPMLTPAAEASMSSCRSDPLVYLSNGTVWDLYATIGTATSNVTKVAYVMHVPAGITMTRYSITPLAGLTGKETFVLYSDAPARTYKTDIFVQTTTNKVTVAATTTLTNATPAWNVSSGTVNGYNGQHLVTTLTK
jgi:hypothetical protein